MPQTEVTWAILRSKIGEVVKKLKTTCVADKAVAAYAAENTRHFGKEAS